MLLTFPERSIPPQVTRFQMRDVLSDYMIEGARCDELFCLIDLDFEID